MTADLHAAGWYRIFDPRPWVEHALCAEVGGDLWFPDRRLSGDPEPPHPNHVAKAKTICAACPVAAACLDYALTHDEAYGVWGGLTPEERRRLTRPTPTSKETRP